MKRRKREWRQCWEAEMEAGEWSLEVEKEDGEEWSLDDWKKMEMRQLYHS
jgi:hypothetical protein